MVAEIKLKASFLRYSLKIGNAVLLARMAIKAFSKPCTSWDRKLTLI